MLSGVPSAWHRTISVPNRATKRTKMIFFCKFEGCRAVFKKGCNLKDHFRKHTLQKPFRCRICGQVFTQSGNLGRHLRRIHKLTRSAINDDGEDEDDHHHASADSVTVAPRIKSKPNAIFKKTGKDMSKLVTACWEMRSLFWLESINIGYGQIKRYYSSCHTDWLALRKNSFAVFTTLIDRHSLYKKNELLFLQI